ncbi:HypC/HybG/HupF family hydrogenase formation chaperone [Chloroflexota bacterium]
MCLAIPALVKSIDGYQAEVDIDGVTRRVSIQLTPEVNVGDYVLLHTGYAISVIDDDEARETLELLKELSEAQ